MPDVAIAHSRLRWIVIAALLAALSVVAAQPVGATIRHVTNCSGASATAGSLPNVVNAAAPGDTILFDLDCPTASAITLTAQIITHKNLAIDATGRTVVIKGNGATRLFNVESGFILSLTNLTLRDGNLSVSKGGAITNAGTLNVTGCTFINNLAGGALANDGGGAIYSDDTLTVTDSTFIDNSTTGTTANGGAIHMLGTATISGSTFSGNATGSGGGALYLRGTTTVTNSTFTGNRASGNGGAIRLETIGHLTVYNSTVAGGNNANTGGGISNPPGGVANLTNTIVAGNTATTKPDVDGAFTSSGHNLIGKVDGGAGFLGTDQTGTLATALDPKLGPLADNGGPTQTMALLTGSPAVAAGDPAVCTAAPVSGVDQRGVTRPATLCAIGAFEALFLNVTTCTNSGAGSLRDRVSVAPVGYTLSFALDCPTAAPIHLSSEIVIGKNVTIDGTGRTVVISTNATTRLFTVNSTFRLSLVNLTLSDGNAGAAVGGAVRNNGTLNVTGCTFTNNTASTGGAIDTSFGNFATITGSTFSHNNADSAGGAISTEGTVTAVNSTFSGNTGGFFGGAIFVQGGGALTLRNSTIAGGNSASNGGGVYATVPTGTANVTNTIVAGNTGFSPINGPDVNGTFTSGGHNLIGKTDGSTGFANGTNGDQTGTAAAPLDAKLNLAGLADNGGPTKTIALQASSPAHAAGDPAVCASTASPAPVAGLDQRGSPRLTACTIGAYEPPFIASITPNPGAAAGGTHATLIGGGFFPGATVSFGASVCTGVTVTSISSLNCVVPTGSGTVNVTVTAGGSSGVKANAYTYGTVNPLPTPEPTGGSPAGPNPLPNSRPASSPSGSPNPLPQPRSR